MKLGRCLSHSRGLQNWLWELNILVAILCDSILILVLLFVALLQIRVIVKVSVSHVYLHGNWMLPLNTSVGVWEDHSVLPHFIKNFILLSWRTVRRLLLDWVALEIIRESACLASLELLSQFVVISGIWIDFGILFGNDRWDVSIVSYDIKLIGSRRERSYWMSRTFQFI